MTWFRVDDGFREHPKVRAIPKTRRRAVLGVWLLCGTWSARHLTDGFIPHSVAIEEGGRSDVLALVECGLWVEVDGGYQYHDWHVYQPSRGDVEERRRQTAERVAKWRAAKAAQDVTPETSNGVTPALVTPPPARPVPTRPEVQNQTPPPTSSVPPPPSRGTRIPPDFEAHDGLTPPAADAIVTTEPTRRGIEVSRETGRKQPSTAQGTTAGSAHKAPAPRRGSRLPADFSPTPGLVSWARSKAPDVPASEHDAFVDFWIAKPDPDGRKVDWEATWRTWMRRAQADIATGRRAPASGRRSTTDERVAQAQALRANAEALDAADHALTLVPPLALEGAS